MTLLLRALGSNTTVAFFGCYLFFVLLLEAYGFVSFGSNPLLAVLYAKSVLISVTAFLSVLLLRLSVGGFHPEHRGGSNPRGAWVWRGLTMVGILVVALGFWIGRFTHFEGAVRLTEGQGFSGMEGEYMQGTLHRGVRAAVPQVRLQVEQVTARFSADGYRLKGLGADILWFSGEGGPEGRKVTLGRLPTRIGRLWLDLEDFGYSPYYRLEDEEGSVLDEAFVALALFPPGSEDYFRLLLPHTFFVRYDPPGVGTRGETGEEDTTETSGMYRLRIARNKDIVFNDPMVPGERVDFENGSITLDPPRRWVRIRVVRDVGIPLMLAGCGLCLPGFLMGRRGTRADRPGVRT